MTKDFIKAVFAGEKQLLKKVDVITIEVPHYEELSVKNIYPSMRKDAEFQQYFPDQYPKGKGPPRDYFFNILNTMQPDYLSQIIQHAAKQRLTCVGEDKKNEAIKMSEYWKE